MSRARRIMKTSIAVARPGRIRSTEAAGRGSTGTTASLARALPDSRGAVFILVLRTVDQYSEMGFRWRAEGGDARGPAERAGHVNAPLKWASCDHGAGCVSVFGCPRVGSAGRRPRRRAGGLGPTGESAWYCSP